MVARSSARRSLARTDCLVGDGHGRATLTRLARTIGVVLGVLGGGVASGCRCSDEASAPTAPRASAGAAAAASTEADRDEDLLLSRLHLCDLGRAGATLDFGTARVDPHRDFALGPFSDMPTQEFAGASFSAVTTSRTTHHVWVHSALDEPAVGLRLRGGTSKQIGVYLDGRRLGSITPTRERTTAHSLWTSQGIEAGLHSITLRYAGGSGSTAPRAWLDWLRLGPRVADESSHAAATVLDTIDDVALGDVPRRALVFRSGSSLRCPAQLPAESELRLDVGMLGPGSATARVSLLEEGEPPVVLAEQEVEGGQEASWQPTTLNLEPFGSRFVTLELSAVRVSGAGRLIFGEPRITTRAASPPVQAAQAEADLVLVVVGAGLGPSSIPPWGPHGGLVTLAGVARESVAYDRYRVPITLAAGTLATLLTGLSPRGHGLRLPKTRLAASLPSLATLNRHAGGLGAMFSSVPSTFAIFGFDHGWDRYEQSSPVSDDGPTRPYEKAAEWLRNELASGRKARRLLLIHSRAAHPPWDVTRSEARDLPPAEYDDRITPRRAALQIADLTAGGRRGSRLRSSDWTRIRALQGVALRKEDAALGSLLELLRREDLLDRAMIVVVGDVSTGQPPRAPFSLAPPLHEAYLQAPLLVRFPRGTLAGKHVAELVTTVDLSRTIARALGLPTTHAPDGLDLGAVAAGQPVPTARALVATLGASYSTRWGPWLLRGKLGSRPALCRVDVDPECTNDTFGASTLTGPALWRATYSHLVPPGEHREHGTEPLPVALDRDTSAALRVFGY